MISVRLEFKLADMWVGAFWRRSTEEGIEEGDKHATIVNRPRLDVWVCLLPCLPIHIVHVGEASRSDPIPYWRDDSSSVVSMRHGWVRTAGKVSVPSDEELRKLARELARRVGVEPVE